ncbi:MAG: amidohydrolase [Bacteroidales bacterium]|nr:amidohydrolase [Bacteroidales bacterium]
MTEILLKNIIVAGAAKDILIRDRLISRIAPAGTVEPSPVCVVMDCSGKTAIPGFINMHTHSGMTLMKGVGEDMKFHDWLARIWKMESKIDPEYIYWATKAAAVEMIRTGTTLFNDQYWFVPTARQAMSEMGVRGAFSYVILDNGAPDKSGKDQLEECRALWEESRGWDDGSFFTVGIHAVYSVCEDNIRRAVEFAREHDLLIHMHLSETKKEVDDCMAAHGGMSPVEYMDSLGALDHRTIAAHTLWLSEKDVQILGERKVTCVHNINSNTKLASGYHFLYNELRDAGANLCIGTDGCASSNNLDMLEAMKTSAIVQKAWRWSPDALPLDELFDMGTVNGARALRENTGVLREGAVADINIVNTDSVFFLSDAPFLANLIYSAHSSCIESVIGAGRFLMRDYKINGEDEILRHSRNLIKRIR